jgi:hypothetical protein
VNRPYYETQDDLDGEIAMMKRLCARKGHEFRKLPIAYRLDFVVHEAGSNKPLCFVECRKRSNPMGQYPTYMVSLNKALFAQKLATACMVKAYLLVEFTDSLGILDFNEPFDVRIGGHNNRGDWQDIELVAHYDIKAMRGIT